MTSRVHAWLVSGALLAAMWWPLWTGKDSFPLSTYPMFSHARPSEIDVHHVIGVRADGAREPVPPALVAHGEVLQTLSAVKAAVDRGGKASRELCRAVAARTGTVYQTLEVRTDRFSVLGYFDGDAKPRWSKLHARCRPAGGQ